MPMTMTSMNMINCKLLATNTLRNLIVLGMLFLACFCCVDAISFPIGNQENLKQSAENLRFSIKVSVSGLRLLASGFLQEIR